MRKQEFLDELKQTLSGEVPAEIMMDTYRYYANYIDEEIQNGKEEETVLAELGKPSLIARSVIAAQTGDREVDVEYTVDGRMKQVKRGLGNSEKKEKRRKEFTFDYHAWYARVLYAFFAILMICIVFVIIKGLFFVFFRFGIPILLILGIIYLILYFVR